MADYPQIDLTAWHATGQGNLRVKEGLLLRTAHLADATDRVYEADVRKYSRRVRFWGGREEEVNVVKSFMGANTENFVKTLDEIDSRYGSLEAYLKGPIGLTDDDIRTLRQRYLE